MFYNKVSFLDILCQKSTFKNVPNLFPTIVDDIPGHKFIF